MACQGAASEARSSKLGSPIEHFTSRCCSASLQILVYTFRIPFNVFENHDSFACDGCAKFEQKVTIERIYKLHAGLRTVLPLVDSTNDIDSPSLDLVLIQTTFHIQAYLAFQIRQADDIEARKIRKGAANLHDSHRLRVCTDPKFPTAQKPYLQSHTEHPLVVHSSDEEG